ncbi:hypothetical protein TWF696_007247 [Orbilia brochopaga]|uniref:HNH nuclease domain-containing protein n=1 Tax=Orbilia brochopaga TaxID=3140254 RepID=A0AAV9UUM8_9PEZI
MASFTFQILSCRTQAHHDGGITLAFNISGAATHEAGPLWGTMNAVQKSEVLLHAEEWLQAWGTFYTPPQPLVHEPRQSGIEATLQARMLSQRHRSFFNAYRFLDLLFHEIPGDGKLNLAVEILLTALHNDNNTRMEVKDAEGILSASRPLTIDDAIMANLVNLALELKDCLVAPFRRLHKDTPSVSSVHSDPSGFTPAINQSTHDRLSILREKVLTRDNDRCVVSGAGDESLVDYLNDEELSLFQSFATLECCHVFPHALNGEAASSEAKVQIWSLLDFISPGVSHELQGVEIDSPKNAITLRQELHTLFGQLKLWFTEKEVLEDGVVYKLETGNRLRVSPGFWPKDDLVILRTRDGIDAPSRRLLEIHRALAVAASLSGAGTDIDKLLRDEADLAVLAQDGSTADTLGSLLNIAISKRPCE